MIKDCELKGIGDDTKVIKGTVAIVLNSLETEMLTINDNKQ